MAPPKQTDPQFKLRMTPEIKELIEKAADENGRSMNAEILSRLEAHDELQREALSLARTVSYLEEVRAKLETELDDAQEGRPVQWVLPPNRTLYVALDANGLPLSWPEIAKHLSEIGKAAGASLAEISGGIVDVATGARRSDRDEAYLKLVKQYRSLRKAVPGRELHLSTDDDLRQLIQELKNLGYEVSEKGSPD